MAYRGKKPIEYDRDPSEGRKRNSEEEQDGTKSRENKSTKENEEEHKEHGIKDKAQKEPCKPKATITPRLVLNDPTLQAHGDHMQTYAIICKFMGLWPIEKDLQKWIKYHKKPKESIDLHLGSKGFFIVVFATIEDKDRVFEGGPYFYTAAGLYMSPWIMNFCPIALEFYLGPCLG